MNRRHLPIVYISDELATKTAFLLNSFADAKPSEGVVYWFGIEQQQSAVVTTLIVPNADTTYGSVWTSALANSDAIRVTIGTALVYLGQAHSHPGSSVSHSLVDDSDTFALCEGILSIVVPWFGRYGIQLAECGVHRYVGNRFMDVDRVDDHLRIVPGFADLRKPVVGRSL
jgi:hypothetical protein